MLRLLIQLAHKLLWIFRENLILEVGLNGPLVLRFHFVNHRLHGGLNCITHARRLAASSTGNRLGGEISDCRD